MVADVKSAPLDCRQHIQRIFSPQAFKGLRNLKVTERIERQIDRPSEFRGHHVFYHAAAESLARRRDNLWTSSFAPFEIEIFDIVNHSRESQEIQIRPAGTDSAPYFSALVPSSLSANASASACFGFRSIFGPLVVMPSRI